MVHRSPHFTNHIHLGDHEDLANVELRPVHDPEKFRTPDSEVEVSTDVSNPYRQVRRISRAPQPATSTSTAPEVHKIQPHTSMETSNLTRVHQRWRMPSPMVQHQLSFTIPRIEPNPSTFTSSGCRHSGGFTPRISHLTRRKRGIAGHTRLQTSAAWHTAST